ncbi:MAG: carboxypeptidase M32 [Proteobacteria bacterium]|nr:carboxypeptidase M32 [Pseudomonadota bacterium]
MDSVTPDAYAALEARFKRLLTLGEAASVLHWDSSTMMPPGGAEGRAAQIAELSALAHSQLTNPKTGDLLKAAEDGDLNDWQRANLGLMRRRHAHATALTEAQVVALSHASSACETIWRTARAQNDFATVREPLEKLLGLIRESAAAKSEALGLSPYDALLDEFEPDGRSADIDVLFADLEDFLPGFLDRVMAHQADSPAATPPNGPFPVEAQRRLGIRLMETLGFDFDHGRLDISLHPFCGGNVDDVRITTRYDEDDYASALMGVLHETGHALYERGLPHDWRYQPVGGALGMGMHESQSLLIEMQVCRSSAFLTYAAPLIAEAFAGSGPEWAHDNLHKILTRVEPGMIRVDADEVTYPLHVILRYRLEQALIASDIQVSDLPAAWNDGIEKLLGIRPDTDREGCMQDIHWYDGAWGYFPTYTLGAMTAAQLFAAAQEDKPEITSGIPNGDFAPLMDWLGQNVHSLGSSLTAPELLTRATGKPLDTAAFKAHLQRRYLG